MKTAKEGAGCHHAMTTHKQHTNAKIGERHGQRPPTEHSTSLRSAHCTERHTLRSVPALWPNTTESLCK